jgi:hypothetical protein
MPTVTITSPAALIAALVSTGGAANGDVISEITSVSNSIHEISGVFYVLALNASNHFQMYSSSDAGVTWATVGSSFTPTIFSGGMCTFVVGTAIWVGYSKSFHIGNDQHLYLNSFETLTSAWNSEINFACGASFRVEGPYAVHVRPDTSFAMIISDTLLANHYVVTYDGSFHGPYQLTTSASIFAYSIMVADGTVHVFYDQGASPTSFYHQVFHTDNSIDAAVLATYTGEIIAWNDNGLECGFEDSGSFYLSAALKTVDYPTIWGVPAILFGNDGAWTLGANLDTDVAIADYSMYASSLQLIGGMLIYYWRGVSSNGVNYIERVGYAPQGSHNTPIDWTWTTAYNLASPSPAVSGQTGPYDPSSGKGFTIGVAQTSTESRIVTTVRNASHAIFATYLLNIAVAASPSDTTLLPTGIGSDEAIGSHTVVGGGVAPSDTTIIPSAIDSEEAFGTVGADPGERVITPAGIASRAAFGSTSINGGGERTRYSVF